MPRAKPTARNKANCTTDPRREVRALVLDNLRPSSLDAEDMVPLRTLFLAQGMPMRI